MSTPEPRTPEPSFGPDEEGDVPPPDGRRLDDTAAWVHQDPPELRQAPPEEATPA